MKRVLLAALLAALALIMCGCRAEAMDKEAAEADSVRVEVVPDCGEDIYQVGLYYEINGDESGAGGVACADGSALEKGRPVVWDFSGEGIKRGAQLYLEFSVTDAEGTEYPADKTFTLKAQSGDTLTFVITGDRSAGFIAAKKQP